jgi:DNA-binding response OmpR family regulator
MHVLLVEDDQRLARVLRRLLEDDRHVVEVAHDGESGLEIATSPAGIEVIVLDIGLPDITGLEVARRVRKGGSDVAILMLTARDTVNDRVVGLDAGADDYLIKPFSPEHLIARLTAILRRSRQAAPPRICQVGGLRVDLEGREASLDGAPLDLTRREFDLLAHLAFRAGQVVSRRELLAEVWRQSYGDDQTIDVHLSWLRRKLGETASRPRYLHTVRGVGVKLLPPE